MPSKMNRAQRRAVQATINDMVSVGANLVAGKGSSVHTFFDNARKNTTMAALSAEVSGGVKPQEFNVK